MRTNKLNGILVPHITPFTREGELEEEWLRACLRFWLKSGVSGLIPCASNGEGPYLLRGERKEVIKTVMDEVSGKVTVVAGTGSMSTKETLLFTRDAKDLGVDAALVVTPFYFRISDREIYEHYKTLLEAVDLPMIIYSVPKFTGFALEPNVIFQLASEYDNVAGVKDSGGNIGTITEIIRLAGDKISVLAGTADVILPTLMAKGTGAVVAVANVFPKMCNDLYLEFKRGNYKEAGKLQRQICYINKTLIKEHNQLSALKEAMKMQGQPSGFPRKPVLPLEEEEKKDIECFMKAMK